MKNVLASAIFVLSYGCSIVAILALIIAIAVGISGSRVRNIKVSFMALTLISLAETFSIHGLATPELRT